MPVAMLVATNASVASANASRVRKLECEKVVSTYDSHTATIQQSQNYADCVHELYPKSMTPEQAIGLKIVIVCGLLGMIFGGIKGWRDDFAGGCGGALLFALVGALFGAIAPLLFCGLVVALNFLFS